MSAVTAPGEVLYGRDVERATIRALLEGARSSRGAVVVLRGEAGVGKSALLRDAGEHAEGMQVLSAMGVEAESELAFAGLDQVVRPLLAEIPAIPDHQGCALRAALGLDPSTCSDGFLVSAAVLNLLAAAASERRPLLCLIDDAHWFDDASADALAFVARRLEAEPIVFLFASRVGDAQTFDAPGLPELWLEGLDRGEANQWLIDRWDDEISGLVREQLLDAARGNPLALLELPKALTVEQRAGRQPLGDPLPVTTSVESAFLKRVHELEGGARTLLLVAAADDTADTAIVRLAADSLGVAAADFEAVETAGLLRVGETVVEFCHPLVRSAVYQAASFGKRQTAHRALVDVLAEDRYSDRRAWHRAAATLGPDIDVADELERSADRARNRSGYGAAAAALERSANHTPDEAIRGRRLAAAGEAAWLAGRPARAAALAEEARRLAADPVLRSDIERLRAMIELQEGVPADAHSILLAAAELILPVDTRRAADLLLAAAEAAAFAGDAEGEQEAGRRADAMRADLGDRFELTILAGISELLAGDVVAGAALLREAISSAELSANPRRLSWAGTAALYTGAFPTARKFFSEFVEEARGQGALGLLALALQMLGLAQLAEGRFASASSCASEGLRLASETGQTNCKAHHLAILAWVAAVRGREEECRARAAAASRIATDHGLGIQAGIATAALGELELGLGHAQEAFVHFSTHWSSGPGSSHHVVRLLTIPSLVEAAVRVEHLDMAKVAVRKLADWTADTASELQLPLLERCRGLLLNGVGATEHYERALQLHAHVGRAFDRARTELLYGETLRRARRRSEAREHLHVALDLFEKFGAESWADRARNELRGSGMTARKRDPSTLDQLTPQELQVARLVAGGATNKEVAAQLFLSPRTIDFHLRNIFSKLGITSRTQLSWFQLAEETPGDVPEPSSVSAAGGAAGAVVAALPWDVIYNTGGFAGAISALVS